MTTSRPDGLPVDGGASAVAVDLTPLVRRAALAPSRADQVAAQLSEVIAKLRPGERLGTKNELRERTGVSVGTFNETLRILQSQGQIELRRGPHGGLFVAERSPMAQLGHAVLQLDTNAASVTEAMDIRDVLDPLLIQDAIEHHSSHHLALMREQLDHMAAAVRDDDGIAFLHANWQLHAVIADVSPRPILKAFYVSLLNLIEQHTIAIASDRAERPLAGFHQKRYRVHVQLVDAIASGDVRAAGRVLHKHNAGIARPES
ncbi:FCD domain-containing protein [Pseudonocardia kujensis]|uniref:FadR/GntR family transcriptional regulator n=1 Tax=Pseudonocardia kujensis TaxID=1128675 RepID=UPI001E4A9531|nr:FCD domain-containing protein [Pseudonocardia kujensis]MCE0764907.1 FCD domain-containing protein [Pseudonocardia kujensis]